MPADAMSRWVGLDRRALRAVMAPPPHVTAIDHLVPVRRFRMDGRATTEVIGRKPQLLGTWAENRWSRRRGHRGA